MGDKTGTQNLSRTTSGDDPKLTWQALRTLGGEIDQRVQSHLHDVGRSMTRPFALVRLRTTAIIDRTQPFPQLAFDTVEIDTFGGADLTADPKVINLTVPGWWCIGAYVQSAGFQPNPGDFSINVRAGSSVLGADAHDGLDGVCGLSFSAMVQTDGVSGHNAALGIGGPGVNPLQTATVGFAELWAYKVRDL